MWSLLRGNQSSGERPAGGRQYDVDGGRRGTRGHGEEGRALSPGYSARGFWKDEEETGTEKAKAPLSRQKEQ